MSKSVADLDIQVISKDFVPIGALTELKSVMWPKKFNEYAVVEMWLPITDKNKVLIKEDNILWNGKDAAIIDYVNTEFTENGEKQINVKAKTVEVVLTYRIIWGLFSESGKPMNEIVKDMITANMVAPTLAERSFPIVVESYAVTKTLANITHQKTGGEVYEAVCEALKSYELGFEVKIDLTNKRYSFKILEGINRTEGNTDGNAVVVFDSDLEDILKSAYYLNKEEYKTTALIAGEGEGTARVKTTAGDTVVTGVDRREVWVDANDVQKSYTDETTQQTVTLTDTQYEEALKARGNEKLAEKVKTEVYSATVRTYGIINYEYGVHYFLGDWITIKDDSLGLEINAQITGVEETYDKSYELDISIGYDITTLKKKVKKVLG